MTNEELEIAQDAVKKIGRANGNPGVLDDRERSLLIQLCENSMRMVDEAETRMRKN